MNVEDKIKELLSTSYNPRRKIKINHNIGQSDPMAYAGVFEKAMEDVLGDEAFKEEFNNRMQGYSASLWTQKHHENKVAWRNNPKVEQSGTFYKSFTLFDSLAVENDKGILVYKSLGSPVDLQSKPEIVQKEFKQVLGDLKNATFDNVKEFMEQYKVISENHKRGWIHPAYGDKHQPLELVERIKRQYRIFS